MKIYRDLFAKIISVENLFGAWDDFRKGKRDKLDVQMFERNLEDNLFELRHDLVEKRYTHGAYTAFYVRDPKVRLIHKAEVRDRVVHHALYRCLNPIFEPTFVADSYSARLEKGTHKGIDRLKIFTRKVGQTHGQCFILKCDIKKFFASIDHKILLQLFNRRIKDPDVLWLVKRIVDSFSSEFGTPEEPKGAPIGNLTSQFFANIYMNEFDQFVKQKLKVKYFVRYTDDFVIVHQNREYLLALKEQVADFLKAELKLSLHPKKIHLRKYRQGIDFLGYVVLPKAQVLRTKTKRRILKRLQLRIQQFKGGKITEEKLLQSFNSYLGVLGHARSYELEQKMRHMLWELL